jgi:predicted metal-dependent HD superfamily phosphohydrolase
LRIRGGNKAADYADNNDILSAVASPKKRGERESHWISIIMIMHDCIYDISARGNESTTAKKIEQLP